jgi:hypothetical protein
VLWLDFDWKLVDRNATGAEYLACDVLWNGTWHNQFEVANTGSVDWTSEHIDISGGIGKAIKVRFTAYGENSEDFLHWYVDNICVYGVCNPPTNLEGQASSSNITLTWNSPLCSGGGGGGTIMTFIFDDGTAENGWAINPGYQVWLGNEFPIDPSFEGVIQSVDVWFGWGASSTQQLQVDFYDAAQVLTGSSPQFYTPSEDWLNIPVADVPFSGPFYAMILWNNLSSATNFLGYDENGPYAATDLAWYYDGAAWMHMSAAAGTVPGVFLIRVTALVNGDKKQVLLVPGQTSVSTANVPAGVFSQSGQSFDTKNYQTMGPMDFGDNQGVIGYNVYQQKPQTTVFNLVNASPVTDTTYTVTGVTEVGIHLFYVVALFDSAVCESVSDTIEVTWPHVGIDDPNGGSIRVFPNPATEVVNISSSYTITQVEVTNFLGQAVYTQSGVDAKSTKVNVSKLQAGVYFVKVTTVQGVRAVKITVTR